MSLFNALGGAAAGLEGFNQGRDQERERQTRRNNLDLADQRIAAEQELLPGTTATAKLQQENDQGRIAAANKLLPGQEQLATAEQQAQIKALVDKDVTAVVQSAATAEAAKDAIGGMMGKAIEQRDSASLTRLIDHATQMPMVFPGLNGFGRAVSAAVTDAPEGTIAADGQPIKGPSIQATFADGSVKHLRVDGPLSAWARQKASQEAAGAKILKEGDTMVGASGAVLGRGQPKAIDPRLQIDENHRNAGAGAYRPVGAGAGTGGAGTGAGARGKAPASPQQQALESLNDTLEKNGKDTGGTQAAQAKSRVTAIFASNPGLDPQTAAFVAYDSVTDPTKTSLQINPQSGAISSMYINPEVDGGKPFVVAENSGTPEALEKGLGGKKGVAAAVGQMLAAQGGEARQLIEDYAAGGDRAKAVEAKLAGLPPEQRAAVTQNLQRKAALVKQYGGAAPAAPAAKSGTDAAKPERADRFSAAGLDYTPPADSPAGRVAASRTRANADRLAKEAKAREEQQATSATFQREAAAATTPEQRLELVRKWDAQRAKLQSSDLSTLNKLSSSI